MLNTLEHSLNMEFDDIDYPVTIRRERLSAFPNYAQESHWHDDVEFLSILSGRMKCTINGESVELSQDEGVFINSRQMHVVHSDTRTDCDYVVVRFHPLLLCATKNIESRFVLPVIENPDFPYAVLSPEIEWQRSVLDSILRIYYMRHETTLALGAQGEFFHIWEQIFRHNAKAPAKVRESSPQLSQLKDMINFISLNYQRKISLEDIRMAGNIGKTSCCLIFQKYLNQTPNTYLTIFRLRKGADLLVKTDKAIVEISEEVGFSGASYFAEAFKKHMGEMPSEYRKKRRVMSE